MNFPQAAAAAAAAAVSVVAVVAVEVVLLESDQVAPMKTPRNSASDALHPVQIQSSHAMFDRQVACRTRSLVGLVVVGERFLPIASLDLKILIHIKKYEIYIRISIIKSFLSKK